MPIRTTRKCTHELLERAQQKTAYKATANPARRRDFASRNVCVRRPVLNRAGQGGHPPPPTPEPAASLIWRRPLQFGMMERARDKAVPLRACVRKVRERGGLQCRLLFYLAVILAVHLPGACASSNLVRAQTNSPPTCPNAQFLYTDWSERGHGAISVYRCGPEPVSTRGATRSD